MAKRDKSIRNSNVVNINHDYMTDDYVLLTTDGDHENVKTGVMNIVVVVVLLAIAASLVVGCLNFKVVPANVQDASFHVGGYSVVQRNYDYNPSSLKVGDRVIYDDKPESILGMVDKVEHVGTVKEITANAVSVAPDGGDGKSVERIPSSYVMYELES